MVPSGMREPDATDPRGKTREGMAQEVRAVCRRRARSPGAAPATDPPSVEVLRVFGVHGPRYGGPDSCLSWANRSRLAGYFTPLHSARPLLPGRSRLTEEFYWKTAIEQLNFSGILTIP